MSRQSLEILAREPRGFGFVQYLDPLDAEEAQYHMNHQILFGRELTVIFAEETRKKPFEMRNKERMRSRGFSEDYGRSYYSHRGRSRSQSRSRTPPSWHRYSRSPNERPHSYSSPESPARSPSSDSRHEPRSRRHEGGWSGSERRKYVDRSPSGSTDSPSGRYAQKNSKHGTHSESWRGEDSAKGRRKSPSHSNGSPGERYSRSPSTSPLPSKRRHSSRHSNFCSSEDE